METPPRQVRGSSVPPPRRARIDNHETDLPSPALFAGGLALVAGAPVWIYAGWLWIHPEMTTHGQRYLLFVLSALADLGLVPATLAVVLGLVGVVRRKVGRMWRFRATVAVFLGGSAIGLTAVRFWMSSRGELGR
ncbi:MAG: hypothetical protein ACXVPX_00290 [Actinomycetota bacterium]